MQQFIEVEKTNQFGNKVVRPLCRIGETFAHIAGTCTGNRSTLTFQTLILVQKLGYTIIGPDDKPVENVSDLFK